MSKNKNRARLNKAQSNKEYKVILNYFYVVDCPICSKRAGRFDATCYPIRWKKRWRRGFKKDILIDLLDDKSFKAKVVSSPAQLYQDEDFRDISINDILNMIDLETCDKIGRYSKNRLSFCEMSYENSDLNQLYTMNEIAMPMRAKVITRNFEVIKSNMLLVIKVTGDNSKFFYENKLFMDTYDRLRTYLKEDLIFQSNKSLDDKKIIVIGFNSYSATEIK